MNYQMKKQMEEYTLSKEQIFKKSRFFIIIKPSLPCGVHVGYFPHCWLHLTVKTDKCKQIRGGSFSHKIESTISARSAKLSWLTPGTCISSCSVESALSQPAEAKPNLSHLYLSRLNLAKPAKLNFFKTPALAVRVVSKENITHRRQTKYLCVKKLPP